jgi:dTDP-4-dehydrorhamnose 3,5-epimerase
MKRIDTSLPGVFVIEPTVFGDSRGFFFESYHEMKFAEMGIKDRFVQDNHSRSVRIVLRGLHYQIIRPQS